jgi:hypothetical protein
MYLLIGFQAHVQIVTVSFIMSVYLSTWNTSEHTGLIFTKVDICVFCENLSELMVP